MALMATTIVATQGDNTPDHPARVSIFASPQAGNGNSGLDYMSPVTLHAAQMLARQYIAKGVPVTVYLEKGIYRLSKPLNFGPEDSGSGEDAPTVYCAAADNLTSKVDEVELLGSRAVGNPWQPVGANIFKVDVGKVADGVIFRQFYVNDTRGTRARSPLMPEGGLISRDRAGIREPVSATGADATGFHLQKPLHFENPEEIKNVEVVSLEGWQLLRCPLESVSEDGMTITLQQPCWRQMRLYKVFTQPRITWIENALEYVTHPGDWYHDRDSGYLYYYPRNPAELAGDAEIPCIENLMTIRGSPTASVRNLTIAHLAFKNTNWTGPDRLGGYRALQGGINLLPCSTGTKPSGGGCEAPEGAVDVDYAENIRIADNRFQGLGSSAIHLTPTTRAVTIVSNDIRDAAGPGIFVGGWILRQPPPSNNATPYCEDDLISDNTIQDVGLDYPDAVGLFVGVARHMRVEYNTLRNLPYIGISVGWGFSYDPHVTLGGNHIYRNKVEDCMQMMVDGGGIYTLSNQIDPSGGTTSGVPSGTTIEENFVDGSGLGLRLDGAFADRRNMKTPSVAIYLDHGSSNMFVARNVWDHLEQQQENQRLKEQWQEQGLKQAPYILTPPVFGPEDISYRLNGYASPCGFRACHIHQTDNHQFDPVNPNDMEIKENAGARPSQQNERQIGEP